LFTVLLDFDVVGVLFGFTILILEDDVLFERTELASTVISSFKIGGFFGRISEILTNVDEDGVLSFAEGSSLLTARAPEGFLSNNVPVFFFEVEGKFFECDEDLKNGVDFPDTFVEALEGVVLDVVAVSFGIFLEFDGEGTFSAFTVRDGVVDFNRFAAFDNFGVTFSFEVSMY
jgi:hypothetical protein